MGCVDRQDPRVSEAQDLQTEMLGDGNLETPVVGNNHHPL